MSKALLQSDHIIRFSDCDPLGHLFNVKYLNYFLDAREDQIRLEYNMDMQKLAEEYHWALLVGTHKISFLRPALINEEVTITSAIIEYSSLWALVEFCMLDQEKRTKAFMWTQFVSYNMDKKKAGPMPAKIDQLIQKKALPKPAANFDDRFKQLKSHQGKSASRS